MDGEQNFNSLSVKDEKPWTIDEIRKNSSNWTLAGDVGLFNLLNEFSHDIISRTHEVENAVDSLIHRTKMASAKINNIINDFHMLSNLQFVENRVYDEEIQEPVPKEKIIPEKTKEQKEAEMLPKITKAIELGLTVLDQAFDRINVNDISDSEDEEDISSEGRTILEPKDPYEHRPLPFIIGSVEFQNSDFAGLQDLVEEEIESSAIEGSSISETEESSSDEEEPLPLDEEKYPGLPNERRLSQSLSDKLSSSEESELFASEKEENGFISDSSFETKTKEGKNIQRHNEPTAQEKDARQNSVSSLQSKLNLPQVLPVPKVQEKPKGDGLFTNDDEISDDESPFHKKAGLFTSDTRFDEEKDIFSSDLFGDGIKTEKKEIKDTESQKIQAKPAASPVKKSMKGPSLFENDEDSEDDIFNTLMKTKKPATSKESNAGSQDSSEKAESSSTPSSAPSMKPSGNAFDFVTGAGNSDSLFGDESDGDDLFSSKKTEKKFDFDAFEDDDLFGIAAKKPSYKHEGKEKVIEKKISLFEESVDSDKLEQPSKKEEKPLPATVSKKTKESFFDDTEISDQQTKKTEKSVPAKLSKKAKDSIFDDSNSSDEGKGAPIKTSNTIIPSKKKNEISLFDDEDEDDDIFAQVKKKDVSSNKTALAEKKPALFESSPKKEVKSIEVSKSQLVNDSIFEDDLLQMPKPTSRDSLLKTSHDGPVSSKAPTGPSSIISEKTQSKKTLDLFEDSDNDLFFPKVTAKPAEPSEMPKPTSRGSLLKTSHDGAASSKASSSPSKVLDSKELTDQIGFDIPVDSSKMLNVISKDRVKIAAKRRKPTRKGRLAALESCEAEIEVNKDIPTKPVESILSTTKDLSTTPTDDLFSSSQDKLEAPVQKPSMDYRTQEKKKMNLMSQLISEVSTSRVLKKTITHEEDEVDIFAEAKDKSQAEKQKFSFLSPEENNIDSVLNAKVDLNAANIDSEDLESDFFTEPSFQNFRASISHKDSVLDLDNDDEDEDDLFSTIKTNIIPKKNEAADTGDIFDDDSDIFADIQKEKYEMFPSQLYDNDEDDIFGTEPLATTKNTSSKTTNASVKKVEKQQINTFDDPLTGLLGED